MRNFLNAIIAAAFPTAKVGRSDGKPASRYERAKAIRIIRISIFRNIRNLLFITAGVFSAAFGLESFLLPNNFIDGGATGISLLITEITNIPIYYLLVIINLPFIFIGFRIISKDFAFKAAMGITGLAVVLAFVHFPVVTNDKLLVAVFGGFFLGAGIGLSVRGGGVIDGTEVLAIALSRKLGITIGDVVLVFNIFIFSAAAYILDVETALYSVIIYLSASKTLDFIIEGIEEYTAVTIISPKHNLIRQMIIDIMGRGVTVYRGRRGHGKRGETDTDMDIVYTVITRLEVSRLNAEIEKIDPFAFVVMSSVKDTKGGMIKKRPLH